ncbi:AraC family transcriptional regulator [Emticicia sp. 21SJ11W-3]|uniref:helix-turn-helix domain-containing protein n=1 Tax=Emticicia sp. 21SJ11W-3 TaxID=2916755 RepID=UPI00209FE762|nr:AraC family transcriptional regulator [Emticicia sp. 21SJ11W-3]UTA67049.1 AraC family transcriptional regulator [Emticicia sp. 21SJ11W-3]
MKPLLFRIPKTETESFRVQVDDIPHFYDTLHFHPEWQITLMLESTGTQFVGDNVDRFQPFDLYFLGSNLPHVFRNDAEYYSEKLRAHSVSVYFRGDILGETFFDIPETQHLKTLLTEASRGFRIRNQQANALTGLVQSIAHKKGFEKLLTFLEILNAIWASTAKEYLSSIAYQGTLKETDNQRINDVFEFLMRNYERDVSLDEVANIANMTTNAFCRFFKLRTRRTFSEFLNDIRIGHACRMLQSGNMSVLEVCFANGFNNVSNFNRQFKNRTQLTPSAYLRKYHAGSLR